MIILKKKVKKPIYIQKMSYQTISKYVTDFIENIDDQETQNKWEESQEEFRKLFSNMKVSKKSKEGPKKNVSAYVIFCNEQRAQMKESGAKMDNKDVLKELASRWKNVKENSPAELKRLENLATDDKNRYSSEMKNFTPSDGSSKSKKKEKDPNAVKKPKTAYLHFCQSERKVINSEMPELKGKDVVVELGSRWNKIKDTPAVEKYKSMVGNASSPPAEVEEEIEEEIEEEVVVVEEKPKKKKVEKKEVPKKVSKAKK